MGLCAWCRERTGHGPLGFVFLVALGLSGAALFCVGFRDMAAGYGRDLFLWGAGAFEVIGAIACAGAADKLNEILPQVRA